MSAPVPKIAPSILSSDFARLGEETQKMIDLGAETIHVDVMDGAFVPNLTLGAPIVKSLRKYVGPKAYLDCHLMVAHPGQWVDDFKDAGASGMTVHIETFENEQSGIELLKRIRAAGMHVGVALKPKTAVETVFPYVDAGLVDMVLVMTVEPGFGGQSFMEDMMPKVSTLRSKYPSMDIQVDGGLAPSTIESAAKAGANVIVAGSAIYNAKDPSTVINYLRDAVIKHQTK